MPYLGQLRFPVYKKNVTFSLGRLIMQRVLHWLGNRWKGAIYEYREVIYGFRYVRYAQASLWCSAGVPVIQAFEGSICRKRVL